MQKPDNFFYLSCFFLHGGLHLGTATRLYRKLW